jgi:hypothetical protein
MKYRIVIDVVYDEASLEDTDALEHVLHSNTQCAIERGLLTEDLDGAVVDTYNLRIESLG